MTSEPNELDSFEDVANRIVFYDGECGVCDWAVQFLLERDADEKLMFAALQGSTAAALLPEATVSDLDTMVFKDGAKVYFRSTALLRAVASTGGGVALLGRILLVVPSPIRDACYKLFARNRFRFGLIRESCRLLSISERARFLP